MVFHDATFFTVKEIAETSKTGITNANDTNQILNETTLYIYMLIELEQRLLAAETLQEYSDLCDFC